MKDVTSDFFTLILFHEDLSSTMLVLSFLYACTLIHAALQLNRRGLFAVRLLDTKQMFVMSMATACVLRLMCFSCFSLLDAGRVRPARNFNQSSSWPTLVNRDLDFFARAMVLLFDLPDFMVISTYVLLVMCWAECFFASRKHWLSSTAHKKNWHTCYLVFNAALYGLQMFLYACVFFESVLPVDGIRVLYVALALITLLVPLIHPVLYVCVSLRLAGFPIASTSAAQRLHHLSRVLFIWTCGRALWGAAVATSLFEGALGAWIEASDGATTFSCALIRRQASRGLSPQKATPRIIALFVATEIGPFILTLDSGFLQILEQDILDESSHPVSLGYAAVHQATASPAIARQTVVPARQQAPPPARPTSSRRR